MRRDRSEVLRVVCVDCAGYLGWRHRVYRDARAVKKGRYEMRSRRVWKVVFVVVVVVAAVLVILRYAL